MMRWLKVTLCLLSLAPLLGSLPANAAPGDVLFQEDFERGNVNALNNQWTLSGGLNLNTIAFNSGTRGLVLDGSGGTLTSDNNAIDANVPAATLSFWVRRGFDTQPGSCDNNAICSEYPENNENLQVQYLNSANSWVTLQTYLGGGTSGEVINASLPIPTDGLYSGLRIRFVHTGGNAAVWDFWHVDDVAVTEASPPSVGDITACTVDSVLLSDTFDSTTNWVVEPGARLSTVAFESAATGLAIDGRSPAHNVSSLAGLIDTDVAEAAIRFWVRRGFDTQGGGCPTNDTCSEYPENGENLLVQYLNSSNSWVTLQTYTGGGTEGEIFVYDAVLPADALHSNFRLRFRHTGGNGSTWDFWHVDNVSVGRCTSGGPDHYNVSAPANGITCEAMDIDITAQDGLNAAIDPQGATATVSTSNGQGSWSGTGVTNLGGGSASVVLNSGTTAPTTIQLSYPTLLNPAGDSFTIIVDDTVTTNQPGSGAADATDNPTITFQSAGFRFVDDTAGTALLPNQVAGISSPQTLLLQAIQTSTTTGECEGVYANGATETVEMAVEYRNPVSGTQDLSIAGTAITPVNDNSGLGVSGGYQNLSLTFGANSAAAIPLRYDDVGQLQLHVRDTITLPAGVDTTLTGTSNDFVVRPHHFAVTLVESNDATPIANPGTTTTTAAGNGFIAAGTQFTIVVEAQDAQGDITPNYGNEAIAEGIELSTPTLVYPTGTGVEAGALSNPAAFSATATAGEFENSTISWSEVGSFIVTADVADGDYLGTGAAAFTTQDSTDIGRFFPASFAITADTVATNSCTSGSSDFSYLSEPGITIEYTLQALNANGAVTRNYDNTSRGYGNNTAPTHMGAPSYHAENNDNGTDLGSRFADGTTNLTWLEGEYVVNSTTAQFNREPGGTRDGPFASLQLSLSVNEPDGAALQTTALNQNPTQSGDCATAANCSTAAIGYDSGTSTFEPLALRFGRAVIASAHGPESSPLPVTFGIEYWNGSQYLPALDDQCTRIAFDQVDFNGSAVSSSPETVNFTGGTTQGSFLNNGTEFTANSGTFGLIFSAPGNTGSFPVDVDLMNYPWLRSDWNQDGDMNNDTTLPQAIISFGSYRGHDRVIYWRERFD